jgi:arylsulfatase A-like enzyme
MKTVATLLGLLLVTTGLATVQPSVKTPNVLLIMADDLRDFGGAYTREVVKTPHLDRLAARGVRFERAFAQYPVCNPSRTSMLLGLRCEQTGIVGNQQHFRAAMPGAVTFPQLLRQNGWTTRSFGKILHAANTGEAVREQWLDTGRSWDHAEILPAQSPHRRGEFRNLSSDLEHTAVMKDLNAKLAALPPWPAKAGK